MLRPAVALARILELLAIHAKDKALHPSSVFSVNRPCGFVSPPSSTGVTISYSYSMSKTPKTPSSSSSSSLRKTTKRRVSTSSADSNTASNNNNVQYFLLKSEPSEYSISDMERDKTEEWGGIRNFQARNYLRSMNIGDRAFFYHSKSSTTGIVGSVKIVRTAQPDASALDPTSTYYDAKSTAENCRWDSVLIEYEQTFPCTLTLKELKEEAAGNPDGVIANMALFKQTRLSVVPLTSEQWEELLRLIQNKNEPNEVNKRSKKNE